MILIITGSRNFRFNRLLKAVDDAIELGLIKDEVFAQVGSSDYKIKNYNCTDFLNKDEFNEKLLSCDILLTHGGTGTIVNSLKLGKKIVAIPRLREYEEAIDNHQIELIETLGALGFLTPCMQCTAQDISDAIIIAKDKVVKPYVSNTSAVLNSIESFIERRTILMCGSDPKEKGGICSVVNQLLNNNWEDKFEYKYLVTYKSGNFIKKSVFFIIAYCRLLLLLRKNFFDIIHIHMSYNGSFYRKYLVTKLCKKYGKKVILHLHGSKFKDFYNDGSNKRKKLIIKLLNISDVNIALGNQWKQFIHEIAPEANVVVINNAVCIPDIQEKKLSNVRTFLFLGQLIKRKGVNDIIEAVKLLKNNGISNFRVLIAGSGPEYNNIKILVKEYNLNDYVEFLGWVTNEKKSDLFNKSDVLLLPSYNEGLPIAILEAMSYAIPIISTDVGAISEAVNIKNGFLIKPGDISALARAMADLILNVDIWKAKSLMSRNICATKFSEKKFFNEIENVYKNCINM